MRVDVQSELASIALHLARSKATVAPWMERVRETWIERAAIREYLGGMPRAQAEMHAIHDTCEALGIEVVPKKPKPPRARGG